MYSVIRPQWSYNTSNDTTICPYGHTKGIFTLIATPSLSKYFCDSSSADQAPATHPVCFPRNPWVVHHNAIVIHQIVCSHCLFSQPSSLLSKIILHSVPNTFSCLLRPICPPHPYLTHTTRAPTPFPSHTHTCTHRDTKTLRTSCPARVPWQERCPEADHRSTQESNAYCSVFSSLMTTF